MTSISTRSTGAWVRSTLEILLLIALAILVMMLNTAPELTLANVIVYSGGFSAYEKGATGEHLIRLAGYNNPFAIPAKDSAYFDESGFEQDVQPGDSLSITVIEEAAQQAEGTSQSVRAFEVRTNDRIYLSLTDMIVQNSIQRDLYLSAAIAVLGFLVIVLLVYSILAKDYVNIVEDLRAWRGMSETKGE